MGYNSHIRLTDVTVVATRPEVDIEKEKELELLRSQAEKLGLSIAPKVTAPSLKDEINSWLKTRRDYIGFWIYAKETADPFKVVLEEVGENGKAYEWDRELEEFVGWLKSKNLVLNGTFYRSGEDQGDVTRYRVTNNSVEEAEAKLSFPDGEVYND